MPATSKSGCARLVGVGMPVSPPASQTAFSPSLRRCSSSSRGSAGSSMPPSSASCSWAGRSRLKKPMRRLLRLDEAVRAVAAPVDDVDVVGIRVAEDEEVVPDELELEHRLLGRHRLDRELLRLDEARLARRRRLFGLRLGERAGLHATATAPLLAVALDLALELVDELVDRRLHVGRRLARAEHGPLRPDGGLGDVVRRHRGVALDRELELDARRVGHEPVELSELLLRVTADRIADLDVPTLDLETHRLPKSTGRPSRT